MTKKNQQSDVVVVDDNTITSLVPAGSKDLVTPSSKDIAPASSNRDPLHMYLREISRYRLLDPEEEKELTETLHDTGDIEVAKVLVKANLRLVVKIALEYRYAYQNVMDLIQEGNIGLMKAVSKFDPSKGAKLSYYSSWWIKSYILKFILDNFRLVKVGTTREQKRLFYNLMKEKERLTQMGVDPSSKALAESLGVSEKAVIEMDQRLSSGQEMNLDAPLSADGQGKLSDLIADESEDVDELLANHYDIEVLRSHLGDFLDDLKERDRKIFSERLLAEAPKTLQEIADQYGVSRERIRQIEARLMEKLKVYMSDYIR